MRKRDRNKGPATPPEKGRKSTLNAVVEDLCALGKGHLEKLRGTACKQPLPSQKTVSEIVEALRSVLFPGYFGKAELTTETMGFYLGATLDWIQQVLQEQIRRGLCFACEDASCHPECEVKAKSMNWAFIERLPVLQRVLATDVQAAYEGDPAATSPYEAIFCYPGVLAITDYRLAHELYHLRVPLIPRMMTEHAHSITGIDIHPGAEIGESFFIDHGTGVVIGETCVIGKKVRIYQGVTLGAKSFPLDQDGKPVKGIKRHPVVEDDVIIYSEATILGRVTIGRGSVIGGNVWLTRSVPPGSRITQAQAQEDRFEDGGGI